MKVKEAAARLGLSERRVRALAGAGAISARKVGRVWQIGDATSRPGRGRPLGMRAQKHLTEALHNRSLTGLSGHDRSRTAQRIGALRASDRPADLLRRWFPHGAQYRRDIPANFGHRVVALAHLGRDRDVADLVARRAPEYLRAPSDLADLVSSERLILGLSVDDLAAHANTPTTAIRGIEQGGRYHSPAALRRVLSELGIEATAIPAPVVES